jgi:hypothetical protein
VLSFGKHFEFVSHALAGEIDGLKFEGAPVERVLRGMDEDIVNPTDKVAGVLVLVVRWWPLGPEPVKKSDFAEHDWFRGLQKLLSDPAKYGTGFEETGRASGDDWAGTGDWAIGGLLVKAE